MSEETPLPPNQDDHFEWKRLLLRKDRPLPKAGCSWAFYIVLAVMIVYLVIMFVKYKNS
ncbi:MAG: hypothetical protein IJM88_04330 [Bacteroidales bacterium]|nr:hypothetical protein [Bacteroidales bacterium]